MSRLRIAFALFLVACALQAAAAGNAPPPSGTRPTPDPAAVAAGAKLYAQYCQVCHGKTGLGDGPGAAGLKPKPRNFREPKQMKSKTDEDLVKVISKGGPSIGLSAAMVGWSSVLKAPQIRQVVAHVRSLGDSAAGGKEGARGNPK